MSADLEEIVPLDRFSLYAELGLVRLLEPDTEDLMRDRALKTLVDDEFDSPHAMAWFQSFHASAFPCDPTEACERHLVYRMMNVPAAEPMPPWVTSCGEVGKAGELDISRAWYEGGRMLGVPEGIEDEIDWDRLPRRLVESDGYGDVHQLGFSVPEVWLTASTDLMVLKKGWTKVLPIEIKGKADEVLEEMIRGVGRDGRPLIKPRGPDASHTRQLRATIGAARLHDWGEVAVCRHCWRIAGWSGYPALYGVEWDEERNGCVMPAPWSDAFYVCAWCPDDQKYDDPVFFRPEPPDCGVIYYWSRSWPRKIKEFAVNHDEEVFRRGLDVLSSARQHFLDGTLPPRPDHFQWSLAPCNFCAQKASCRLDSGLAPRKRKPDPDLIRTTLAESHAVDHARSLRPHYDLDAIRARVLETWS